MLWKPVATAISSGEDQADSGAAVRLPSAIHFWTAKSLPSLTRRLSSFMSSGRGGRRFIGLQRFAWREYGRSGGGVEEGFRGAPSLGTGWTRVDGGCQRQFAVDLDQALRAFGENLVAVQGGLEHLHSLMVGAGCAG